MNSWERVLNILRDELKVQLKQELLEDFKTIVKEVIRTEAADSSCSSSKEYMHMQDLLREHKISKSLFFKIRKQNYFHGVNQGRFKVYNVKQFIEAKLKYIPIKPIFIKDSSKIPE